MWVLSVLCDAFHCTPSQAAEEPLGQALHILDMRRYAQSFHDRDRWQKDPDAMIDSDAVELIERVEKFLSKRSKPA